MHPVLHRVRRAAIHKLLSAVFLCVLGFMAYVALLAGGGWWLALLLTTSVQGIEAEAPGWFFSGVAVAFCGLLIVEWIRRRKKSLQLAPENTPWVRAPLELLLLGPGCVFSLWDLATAGIRILGMDAQAVQGVLGTMGTGCSVRVSKLSGLLTLSPGALEETIHAMQLLDLIYLAERNGALTLVANDGPGKSLCRTLRAH